MGWLPLSQRTGKKPALTGPYEGVPQWLRNSLLGWVADRFRFEYEGGHINRLERVERKLKVVLSLGDFETRLHGLVNKVLPDDELFLDLIDCLLDELKPYGKDREAAAQLHAYLEEAGSVWTVGLRNNRFYLERRACPEALASAEQAIAPGDAAGQLLASAWNHAYGRNRNPSAAYWDAVRAVEELAGPVITPRDPKPSLGKMVPALRAAPHKWQFILRPSDGNGVEMVATTLDLLWKSQQARHGGNGDGQRLIVSFEEGEAAVQLAVTLVNWLRSGALKLNP